MRRVENNSLRIGFLNNCLKTDIIPQFLRLRIPNNGRFDDKSVHEFQKKLLKKEIVKAREDERLAKIKLTNTRRALQ